jgi:D-serine dehydratase
MTAARTTLSEIGRSALADPLVAQLADGREADWYRADLPPAAQGVARSGMPADLVSDARERFRRFAPWFRERFPQTRPTAGILESPLICAPGLRSAMDELTGRDLPGTLWVKRDDALPVSGSIKARGGIHEVLQVTETLLAENCGTSGRSADIVSALHEARPLLAEQGISVGSTGNLGLSIGIISAALGFRTTVHMSADARRWKKDLLRSHGVDVIEHPGDFSAAVDAGRREAENSPSVHFVDDESSLSLFAGYAVAAQRLAGQFASLDVEITPDSPLIVYLPCGVGGGPGGIAYGLKQQFGDSVRCVFAEPTKAPSMFLGVRTGLHSGISVQDIGLDGRTAADGLAVGRPSRMVGERIGDLIDGFVTVDDDRLKALVAVLDDSQSWQVEPSAVAGVPGPWRMHTHPENLAALNLDERAASRAHHLVWFTGGSMVPQDERDEYVREGRRLAPDILWS